MQALLKACCVLAAASACQLDGTTVASAPAFPLSQPTDIEFHPDVTDDVSSVQAGDERFYVSNSGTDSVTVIAGVASGSPEFELRKDRAYYHCECLPASTGAISDLHDSTHRHGQCFVNRLQPAQGLPECGLDLLW